MVAQREVPLEVHLPEVIRQLMLEANRSLIQMTFGAQDMAIMSAQDRVDSAVMRPSECFGKQLAKLTRAPVRVLQVQRKDLQLHLASGGFWR